MVSETVLRTLLLTLLALPASAQVMPLGKVTDVECRGLQQKYAGQLQQIAADASKIHFPFPFYFSQVLDIDEAKQKLLPQGSLRFERVNGTVALAITGNYYISYSGEKLNKNQRARRTFQDVILPILKAEVSRSGRGMAFESYAFEVSHHVRSKVLKVETEGPENLLLVFPRALGERLAAAKDDEGRQAALLESEIYLNGEALTLWLTGDDAPADVSEHYVARHQRQTGAQTPSLASSSTTPDASAEPGTLVDPRLLPQPALLTKIRNSKSASHEWTPSELEKLQTAHDATLRKLVTEFKEQAHFVDYAPPAFIAFRDAAYLQLNMTTDLEPPAGPSQYRIAALAFDNHISHIVRGVSKYFHEGASFEGVDFSTTVHQAGQPASMSVEYFVPMGTLLCYEKYDCTGQELINRSIVLINGERVSLDLLKAESDFAGPR